jgi:hypothetical protein
VTKRAWEREEGATRVVEVEKERIGMRTDWENEDTSRLQELPVKTSSTGYEAIREVRTLG